MKHLLTFLILTTVSLLIMGQRTTESESSSPTIKKGNINTTFFILGTLTDYLGHFYYVNKPDQVDRYSLSEKPLMDYLNRLIEREYRIKITTTLDKQLSSSKYETFSKELSALLNSYYGKDNLLIDSLFKNPIEIYSYLAGQYYRYGEQLNDSIYKINLTNSPNRKKCDILLRKIGCKHFYVKDLKNNIPAHFIIYFVPSSGLKPYFEYLSKQKIKLDESYIEYMGNLVRSGKEEYQNAIESNRKRELAEIFEFYKK
jgi:hypothetical protein